MPKPEDWKRLGQLLQQRRVALNPDFKNRAEFVRATGINNRLAQDIEGGSRTNYDLPTITYIEAIYEWEQGSIERVLRTLDPVPLPPSVPIFADPEEQAVALEAWNKNVALADEPAIRRKFSFVAVGYYRQRRGNGGEQRARRRA